MSVAEQELNLDLAQVFRRGIVLDTSLQLDRPEAEEFAKKLVSEWDGLFACLQDGLADEHVSPLPGSRPILETGRRVIVKFPDLVLRRTNSRDLLLGVSGTVCQDHIHSKNWVRVTHNTDVEAFKKLAERVSGLFSSFYVASLAEYKGIDGGLESAPLHQFEIYGADTVDPELLDLVGELFDTGSLKNAEAFEKTDLIEPTLRELLKNKRINSKSKKVSELLNQWYTASNRFVSVPAIDTHRSIYFIDVDEQNKKTTVNGLSLDTSFWGREDRGERLQPSSHFTTGKIAAELAADL